ncbi:acyl carrier protein [Salmonella enterica subsp. enterica serovar Choleraesuis]|nr:acyl carrier protein [Salmonella enterica subsp. enterica serovar Choleraesuis]
MDKSVLKEKINEIMEEEFELDSADMKPEADLYEDLGMDSLDAVDMVIAFEKAFSIKIGKDTGVLSIKTLGQLQDFVIEKIEAQKA